MIKEKFCLRRWKQKILEEPLACLRKLILLLCYDLDQKPFD